MGREPRRFCGLYFWSGRTLDREALRASAQRRGETRSIGVFVRGGRVPLGSYVAALARVDDQRRPKQRRCPQMSSTERKGANFSGMTSI
jgi:hypothetical protein